MRELLAGLQILVSNGILFVEDADTTFEGMTDLGEGTVTVAEDGGLLVRTRHDAAGLVTASVVESDGETELKTTVFEGDINLRYGHLRVRDVGGQNAIMVGFDPGPCHVRIAVDDAAHPSMVEILVPPL
jgi:hypothetical protein